MAGSLREELLHPPDGVVVQASQDPIRKPAYVSLKNDPDPVIFKPEVWEAVRKYQDARKAR
jgi:hypothetical protein